MSSVMRNMLQDHVKNTNQREKGKAFSHSTKKIPITSAQPVNKKKKTSAVCLDSLKTDFFHWVNNI